MPVIHPDLAAFVAKMRERPDDDTIRLVAADWFEERGEDARAEFIRVQVELARKGNRSDGSPCQCWGCIALRDRESTLWGSICIAWMHELGICMALTQEGACNKPIHGFPRRGFIESVTCPAAAWVEFGDRILESQPVTRVRLTTEPVCEDNDELFSNRLYWLQGREFSRWRASGKKEDDPTRWFHALIGSGSRHLEHNPIARALVRSEWFGIEFEFPPPPEPVWVPMRDFERVVFPNR